VVRDTFGVAGFAMANAAAAVLGALLFVLLAGKAYPLRNPVQIGVGLLAAGLLGVAAASVLNA
jgi:hypothetical protein